MIIKYTQSFNGFLNAAMPAAFWAVYKTTDHICFQEIYGLG